MGYVAEVGGGVADHMVEALAKDAKNSQNLMESKHVCGIFVGRGMSRAFERAKERENRTPDELVMAETKFERS